MHENFTYVTPIECIHHLCHILAFSHGGFRNFTHKLKISHTDHGMEDIFIKMLYSDTPGALWAHKIANRDHASYAEHLMAPGIRAYDVNEEKGS